MCVQCSLDYVCISSIKISKVNKQTEPQKSYSKNCLNLSMKKKKTHQIHEFVAHNRASHRPNPPSAVNRDRQ